MSKSLLISALLILFVFSTKLISGDNDILSSLPGGDEEEISAAADSTDALTVFSAKIKDKTVYINWRVLNPKDISYFEIYRLDPKKKDYKKINESKIQKDDFFEKAANSTSGFVYMYDFEDEPERDGVYFYKMKGFSGNGTVLFEADELKIGITGIKNFKVEQNTPNPFNPTTNITYELFDASYVKLKVFDLIGKEIATLVDANQQKGTYTVTFDASKYANLTSGIYFYKLETEKYSEVKKMIMTK
ncbi:MAG TPA: T9SS type A sorting domain-containing protein [Ignavibacteria bacterium]|nr:T9SS type A sorting domain-containing protein [Ignavibacteria bacterium]HMR00098.1 T9SS type A sorting domain-containing protein [Ignavibacteria bacterium]